MKVKIYTFSVVIIATTIVYFIVNTLQTGDTENQFPNDWFYFQRSYPNNTINPQHLLSVQKYAQSLKEEFIKTKKEDAPIWEFVGPTNIEGRITDIEMPENDQNTIYAGAASGGIFKSTDQGETWISIFDDQPTLSIGDIAISKSDPNIIYVGTGEANAGGGSVSYDGLGVYKSVDAGLNWQHMGLENVGSIGKTIINPKNPEIVYIAAMGSLYANNQDRGIYKSSNGGASWDKVLYVNDSTGFIDMVINPDNPDTLYAAAWQRVKKPDYRIYGGESCGIYKSVDGGNNWSLLTNGLPTTDKGRIGLTLSSSNPNILYALYASEVGYFKGVYKTIDHGETWQELTATGLTSNYFFSSYGWWFGRIEVDPTNPDILFATGLDLFRSIDGGEYWSNVSSADVHVDQHSSFIHPLNNNLVVIGCDGGVYISENGGTEWTHNKKLPITQFYTCEVDPMNPNVFYGGTQDNGTLKFIDENNWINILGGDGFVVKVDPSDSKTIYAESQYGNIAKSTNEGYSFTYCMSGIGDESTNWKTPFIIDPNNSSILYYGTDRIYKSNKASNWVEISPVLSNQTTKQTVTPFGTVTTIDVSPISSDIIYAGTDDANVWNTLDGGTSWNKVTNGLPNRYVTAVANDPFSSNTAYVCFSGYRYNEYLSHVYKTTDNGITWTDISSNLPESPANDIIIDPITQGTYYIATDVGVYVSENSGESWSLLAEGLPNVPITDLTFHEATGMLAAATYGRSMYKLEIYGFEMPNNVNDISSNNTSLKIFPNPVKNSATIEFTSNNNINGEISIYDLSGKKVNSIYKGNLNKGKNTFSFNRKNLPNNIYILKLSYENKIYSCKFTVQD